MNKSRITLAAAALGAIAAASGALSMAPANAEAMVPSHTTATPSDSSVVSGQQFTVSGVVSSFGKGIPAQVTVKELLGGKWVALSGATMHTTSKGTYTIRVILQAKGDQKLRIVGNPDTPAVATTRATFPITVS